MAETLAILQVVEKTVDKLAGLRVSMGTWDMPGGPPKTLGTLRVGLKTVMPEGPPKTLSALRVGVEIMRSS